MTRKDYILIAKALNEALIDIRKDSESEFLTDRARAILSGERAGVHLAALRLVDKLSADNPRFERIAFLKAVGMDI